jgi:hypothetical protein
MTDHTHRGDDVHPVEAAMREDEGWQPIDVRKALEPVLHWYQSDEHGERPTIDIIHDVVADLQNDRNAALLLHRIVIELRKVEGKQAHQIMPQIWPLLCEASEMMPLPAAPTEGKHLTPSEE